MAIVACPECSGKLSTTAKKCPHCGHESGAMKCPDCQGEVPQKAETCPTCGYPLVQTPPRTGGQEETRACPHCEETISVNSATCKYCGEAVRGKIVSYCERCRDQYVVDEGTVYFTCPGCGRDRNIAKGIKLLGALEARKDQYRKRRRFMARPGTADIPEPSSAMVFAILGLVLFCPLSIIAIVQGKPGGAARILGFVGLTFWMLAILGWFLILHR